MPSAHCKRSCASRRPVSAVVEMNHPGVFVLGDLADDDRGHGMGIVVEYAGARGKPLWRKPPAYKWDYTVFGTSAKAAEPDHVVDERRDRRANILLFLPDQLGSEDGLHDIPHAFGRAVLLHDIDAHAGADPGLGTGHRLYRALRIPAQRHFDATVLP